MSKRFTITIANAWWSGSDTLQFLYTADRVRLGHVGKYERNKFTAYPYGRWMRKFKTMSAAKRYVIRQLAKPEKAK